jgi:membrane protease YdiL (CAAX protease family)
MRAVGQSLFFWGAVLAGTVALAASLAAPLHELLLDWGFLDAPGAAAEDHRGFLKVFRRLLLLPLVVALVWRLKLWRNLGLRRYGLLPPRALEGVPARPAWLFIARPFAFAFLITVGVMGAVLAAQFLAGWLQWEDPLRWHELQRRVGRAFAGALALSLVEEWFFRGWLLERFRLRLGFVAAACASAFVFALLHAFRPSNLTVDVTHDAAGALDALRGWLAFMLDPVAFGPSFLGLFCFALLLTAAWRRSRTLWTAIGIHAGAVWVLLTYGALTVREPERTWAGTRVLYDGLPVWALLLLLSWRIGRGITAREALAGARAATADSPEPREARRGTSVR